MKSFMKHPIKVQLVKHVFTIPKPINIKTSFTRELTYRHAGGVEQDNPQFLQLLFEHAYSLSILFVVIKLTLHKTYISKPTYLYAGIQTSGLLDVVNKTNICHNVVPKEVKTIFPCWVSSNRTYATQLENRRNKKPRACS